MYTIKQAALRSGVNVALLRAWERRYGIVEPMRTDSGYRLSDEAAIDRLARPVAAEEPEAAMVVLELDGDGIEGRFDLTDPGEQHANPLEALNAELAGSEPWEWVDEQTPTAAGEP